MPARGSVSGTPAGMATAVGVVGALAVVEAWLDAVNEQDAAHVEALSNEQVEIVGPRGQGMMDRSVLGQWIARAGFTSQPVRWFCGADGA